MNRGIRIPKITRNVGLQVNSRPLQEAKTVPKKIDIGGAPEEIFLDDDDCNCTEKADTWRMEREFP